MANDLKLMYYSPGTFAPGTGTRTGGPSLGLSDGRSISLDYLNYANPQERVRKSNIENFFTMLGNNYDVAPGGNPLNASSPIVSGMDLLKAGRLDDKVNPMYTRGISGINSDMSYRQALSALMPEYSSLFTPAPVAAPATTQAPTTAPSTGAPSALSPALDAILNPSANPNLPVTDHPLAALLQPDPSTMTPEQKAAKAAQNNYDIMNMPNAPTGNPLNGPGSVLSQLSNLAPLNTVNRAYFPEELNYFYRYGQMPEYSFFHNLATTSS